MTKTEIVAGWCNTEFQRQVGAYPLDACPLCKKMMLSTSQKTECGHCHLVAHSRCKFKHLLQGIGGAACESCGKLYKLDADLVVHAPLIFDGQMRTANWKQLMSNWDEVQHAFE